MVDIRHHELRLSRDGITRFEGFFARDEVQKACELIHRLAKDQGLLTSAGWQVTGSRFGIDASFRNALKALSRTDPFTSLINERLLELAAMLVGEPVTPLPPGQQILFTLPGTQSWAVPHDVWHVDTPRLGPLGPPGLQAFICLDDVSSRGGGTLVVSGSHRLQNTSRKLRSKALKQRLGQSDYFRNLFDARRDPITTLDAVSGTVDSVDLDIGELTGRPGDLYLMDLRALHTPAPNASDRARIMLTCRLPRTAVVSDILAPGN